MKRFRIDTVRPGFAPRAISGAAVRRKQIGSSVPFSEVATTVSPSATRYAAATTRRLTAWIAPRRERTCIRPTGFLHHSFSKQAQRVRSVPSYGEDRREFILAPGAPLSPRSRESLAR